MIIDWCNYKWLSRERWGSAHPGKIHWWYDPGCVETDSNNWLLLKTRYNERYFDGMGQSYIGAGLVCCEEDFDYGTFIVEAKLPTGKDLWPAIWCSAVNSWPPEIDIMEAYSNNKGKYVSFNLLNIFRYSGWSRRNPLAYRIETCLHPDKDKPGFTLGAKRHWMGCKPEEKFVKYTLLYYPNTIEIYYNDKLVRYCPKEYVNMFKPPFKFKLNNGKTNGAKKFDKKENSIFTIKSFEYRS